MIETIREGSTTKYCFANRDHQLGDFMSVDREFTRDLGTWQNVLDAVSYREVEVEISPGVTQVVEIPEDWSDTAARIVASKYFRGHVGQPGRESSVKQLIGRVVATIEADGQFQGHLQRNSTAFGAELAYMLVNQMYAFNSPVWFNVGVSERPQSSACFINSVEDTMDSIMDLAAIEARLFKGGSGAGVNISPIRAAGTKLSGSGYASGPLSFMRGWDAFAGAVKSGGKCLAGSQYVYTAEQGPIQAQDLVDTDFTVLSYDPPANRYKVKKAQCWASTSKEVLRVTTDKGQFDVSHDHPWRLSHGDACITSELRAGMSLFACSVDDAQGYLRVHLRDGEKGKEKLHRLIAQDVSGIDLTCQVVHHVDGDRRNNLRENLEVKTQSEHAREHAVEAVAEGTHVFQTQDHSKHGAANPMHKDAAFWTSDKADSYRELQGKLLKESGRATKMQDSAATQRMLNTAYRILNAGGSISTFDEYLAGRKKYIGRVGYSVADLRTMVDERFGGYASFVAAVSASNHRVVSVESLGEQSVFSIEVECPTADDKSAESGHNFVIWPGPEATGRGVVVFNTRRAAKIIVMDTDHADINEFIDCKMIEERKALDLIATGKYTAGFEGEAYASVAFQNANHSVRASDEFMCRASSAETAERETLMKVAKGTWFCGDPGLQYSTTINAWHTCKASGDINASNPCSEFVFLDDTACNLGSLNLMKFRDDCGEFMIDEFIHATQVATLAQEILVDLSSYPTEQIAQNSHDFRPLGLGYANLGALLMSLGMPYDSDEGRDLAASITALMSGVAYQQSHRIAHRAGVSFNGYAENQESFHDVMCKHYDACTSLGDSDIAAVAEDVWADVAGADVFANAQISVLAPCGTIGFFMDCDTTGIEPEMALQRIKTLAGGGTVQLASQTAIIALEYLNYGTRESMRLEGILEFGGEAEFIEAVKPEHRAVFATAFGQGDNISPAGHLKMMAAVQPFLSGAISKTVNVPASTTVQEIFDTYIEAWQLGIKAVAIYRDGSKGAQPVNLEPAKDATPAATPFKREGLPENRPAVTHKFDIGGHEGYITVGFYEDGRPGEIFVKMSKEGSTISGLMDTIATQASLLLQHGVDAPTLARKFEHTKFAPAGITQNEDIRVTTSIVDYVFRYLERARCPAIDSRTVTEAVVVETASSAEACPVCGDLMVRTGTCHTCPGCGHSGGCG